MLEFQNRSDAGKILAENLKHYSENPNTFILALPRGGVPVAYEIADRLNLPLDVFIVRKLGLPSHKELAMGAIAYGDVTIFNDDIIEACDVTHAQLNSVIEEEKTELTRRMQVYRGSTDFPDLHNKTIILVDDGIATGATMRAAIKALRKLNVGKLILAVPVASKEILEKLKKEVDELHCPLVPDLFYAVGAHYRVFDQTTDDEVKTLLAKVSRGNGKE